MALINSFIVKKSIVSRSGFRPMASFLYTIVLPKSSYPYTAFALSNYMFIQFWYLDKEEHRARVTIADEAKKNELEVGSYDMPRRDKDRHVFQQTLILPRIVISEPQTLWITTTCDNKEIQQYPLEFLYK